MNATLALKFRAWGFRFRISGLGFGVWGLDYGVCGLEFGVWGFGLKLTIRTADVMPERLNVNDSPAPRRGLMRTLAFRVQGSGFRVLRVKGSEFRVKGEG